MAMAERLTRREGIADGALFLIGPQHRAEQCQFVCAGTLCSSGEELPREARLSKQLMRLTVLLERSLILVHLLGARRAVVVAEYAEQWAAEVLRHLDWRRASWH